MSKGLWAAAAVAATMLAGCDWTEYQIDLTPKGRQIERKITASYRTSSQGEAPTTLPAAEAEAIAKAYGQRPPEQPVKELTESGVFTTTMPQDVGGAGSYHFFDSDMGKACFYVERFRGNDDLEGQVQQRYQAVDEMVDLLVGWMQTKMQGQEGWPRLRRFMDQSLRKDLKNVAMYVWSSGLDWGNLRWWVQPNPPPVHRDGMGAAARSFQYLQEREYFTPEEVPALAKAVLKVTQDQGWADMLKFLQGLAARKMGVGENQPVPQSLAFLADVKGVQESLREFLRSSKQYQQVMEEWKKQPQQPNAKEPDPMDALSRLTEQAFLPDSGQSDRLTVALKTTTQPVASNGFWDEQAGTVKWSGALPGRAADGQGLPPLCYAFWAQPDRTFQEKRFGAVVLKDGALLEYALWREGLTALQAREWDEFLASLGPGPGLIEKLGKFRFSSEQASQPAQGGPAPTYAQRVIQSIIGSLQPASQPAQPAATNPK